MTSLMLAEAQPCLSLNVLYAQPYDPAAAGFRFSGYEDFLAKAEQSHAEEFEIIVIDGPDGDLHKAAGLDQSTLHWLDDLELVPEDEKPAVFFLLDNGMVADIGEAIAKSDEVCLYSGSLQDAAQDLWDECYAHEIPDALQMYFDLEAFARDLRLGGEFVEFDYEGETFTCTNANGL